MKFVCDACAARYHIDDRKVRGKILRIRCKKCGSIITVREPVSPHGEEAPASAPEPKVRDERPIEWFYAVNGQTFGPLPEDGLLSLFQRGQIGDEAYVWHAGFSEWAPAVRVPVFESAIREAKAAGVRAHAPSTVRLSAVDIGNLEIAAEAATAAPDSDADRAAREAARRSAEAAKRLEALRASLRSRRERRATETQEREAVEVAEAAAPAEEQDDLVSTDVLHRLDAEPIARPAAEPEPAAAEPTAQPEPVAAVAPAPAAEPEPAAVVAAAPPEPAAVVPEAVPEPEPVRAPVAQEPEVSASTLPGIVPGLEPSLAPAVTDTTAPAPDDIGADGVSTGELPPIGDRVTARVADQVVAPSAQPPFGTAGPVSESPGAATAAVPETDERGDQVPGPPTAAASVGGLAGLLADSGLHGDVGGLDVSVGTPYGRMDQATPTASLLFQVRQARSTKKKVAAGAFGLAAVAAIGFAVTSAASNISHDEPRVVPIVDESQLQIEVSREAAAAITRNRNVAIVRAIRAVEHAVVAGEAALPVPEPVVPVIVASAAEQDRGERGNGNGPNLRGARSEGAGETGSRRRETASAEAPRHGFFGQVGTGAATPTVGVAIDERPTRSGPGQEHFAEGMRTFVQNSLIRCNQRQVMTEGELGQSRISIDIDVQPSGRVTAVRLDRTLRDTAFERCLQTHRERWLFPGFDGERVTLQKTYVLQ